MDGSADPELVPECAGELVPPQLRQDPPDNSSVPKPKRLACMICRKRKLRCDGVRPSCSTCARLGHICVYDEQRRKSGPKRGYVKALEERLKQVETMLKTPDQTNGSGTGSLQHAIEGRLGATSPASGHASGHQGIGTTPLTTANNCGANGLPTLRDDGWGFDAGGSPDHGAGLEGGNFVANTGFLNDGTGGDFTWEMLGLGLEEPLPPQETIVELHQLYFEKVHPSMPMIHQYRYFAAMSLAPDQRPPVCLRYAIWTLAASSTPKYADVKDLFYQRARKYLEADYVKGYGEHMVSVAHCQTHCLLASYEMKMMYFPRAWMSTGAAARVAQMTGLHRLDRQAPDVKQCLSPSDDWTESEERRRTFWMTLCQDRYASIGTGWPMVIDERDVLTKLPASEDAFESGRPEQGATLQECLGPSGASKLTPFGGVVLLAVLFGRNLTHLHRHDSEVDDDGDLNGPFWKRHRQMDNFILNTSLSLPSSLRMPAGLSNPNVVFTNMSIHTSTICLHQAAIFKAEKKQLPAYVSSESKLRCITAANEIASIMRTISHTDLSCAHPFISFCLYVSARVFVQYLKSRPEDGRVADSLRFLLSAMDALKRRSPLTGSFLAQLDVDLEALVARRPKLRDAIARPAVADTTRTGSDGRPSMPVCDGPDGISGIMAYRNECHFSKTGDAGEKMAAQAGVLEPLNQAGNVPTDGPSNGAAYPFPSGQSSDGQASAPNGYVPVAWLGSEEPAGLMTPNLGTLSSSSTRGSRAGFAETSASGSHQDTVSGMDEGTSNSGCTPDTGHVSGRGGASFGASPSLSQANMMSQDGVEAGPSASLFGYSIWGGVNEQQGMMDDGASNGWGGMQGAGEMSPSKGEGALRALMNMGPMDAMDLSSWEAAQDGLQ